MKRATRILVGIILSLIFCLPTVLAEEVQKETTFEEIVVTATKTERTIGEVPGRMEVITKEEIQQYSGSASVGYDFNKLNSIGLKVDYYNDKRGEGTKYFAENGIHRDFDTWATSLRYQGGSGDMRWQAKVFWQNENYQRVSERLRGKTYTRFDVDSDRTDLGIDSSFSTPIFTNNLFTVGGDIREGRVDASDIYKTSTDRADNEGRLRIYGLWLQDEMSFFRESLSIVGGLRLDYENSLTEISFRPLALSINSMGGRRKTVGLHFLLAYQHDTDGYRN